MAIDTRATGSTGSALPELAGVGAVALVAMALLTFGYKHRGYDTAQTATPTQTTGAASDQMTKPTLPRSNPADLANPPTSFPDASGNPVDPTRNSPPNPAR